MNKHSRLITRIKGSLIYLIGDFYLNFIVIRNREILSMIHNFPTDFLKYKFSGN